MRVPELRQELRDRGLPSLGLKAELVTRLEADDSNKRQTKKGRVSGEFSKELVCCPICMEYYGDQVFQCREGHCICAACRDKVLRKECPTCRGSLAEGIRNRMLEGMLETMSLPCQMSEHGCTFEGDAQERSAHVFKCEYAHHTCPWSDCEQKIRPRDLALHLAEKHRLRSKPIILGIPSRATWYTAYFSRCDALGRPIRSWCWFEDPNGCTHMFGLRMVPGSRDSVVLHVWSALPLPKEGASYLVCIRIPTKGGGYVECCTRPLPAPKGIDKMKEASLDPQFACSLYAPNLHSEEFAVTISVTMT